jgi:hypothetical protein
MDDTLAIKQNCPEKKNTHTLLKNSNRLEIVIHQRTIHWMPDITQL